MDREVWILVATLLLGGSCTHEVVSERHRNSRNENEMIYKNSDCMKFLVFVLMLVSIKLCQQFGTFLNNSEGKRWESKPCMEC